HHRAGINRRGYRDARRPGAPLSTITDPYPQHVRTRAADVRGLRELRGTHIILLVCTEGLVVEQEMAAPGSAVPEIVLRDRITKRIARLEQAPSRTALIALPLHDALPICHHRAGINRRGYRDARRPGAPLSTITDPYPQHVRTRAADVRGLREL